jgi:hypothetical protein
MAIIICPECGKEISEYAPFCMGCGCPMETIKDLLENKNEIVENEKTEPQTELPPVPEISECKIEEMERGIAEAERELERIKNRMYPALCGDPLYIGKFQKPLVIFQTKEERVAALKEQDPRNDILVTRYVLMGDYYGKDPAAGISAREKRSPGLTMITMLLWHRYSYRFSHIVDERKIRNLEKEDLRNKMNDAMRNMLQEMKPHERKVTKCLLGIGTIPVRVTNLSIFTGYSPEKVGAAIEGAQKVFEQYGEKYITEDIIEEIKDALSVGF